MSETTNDHNQAECKLCNFTKDYYRELREQGLKALTVYYENRKCGISHGDALWAAYCASGYMLSFREDEKETGKTKKVRGQRHE
jgi:hypothetical protein